MASAEEHNEGLRAENEQLKARLAEFEETLWAIRSGQVDALVGMNEVFVVESAEATSNRFRGQVLGQINDVVVATDNDGHITYLNPPAERYYGVTSTDVLGFPLTHLYSVKWNGPLDEAAFDRELAETDHWRGESIHRDRSGKEMAVESSVSVLRNAEGIAEGRLAVVRDIGQRLRAQRSLEDSAQQKDYFLATLAHELRNPLAPLTNGLELLRSGPMDPEQEPALHMMQRQLDHLVRLVDDLMDVSRISRGKLELRKEPVLLDQVLDMAMEASRSIIEGRRHTVHEHRAVEGVRINGDPTRLTQIVTNLLNNAAKYTPVGGRIDLIAEVEGEQAVVRVKDNGIGIGSAVLEKVFDLFIQAEPVQHGASGGLGIGLHLARRLAVMHHGTLVGHSPGEGQGSIFTMRLPVLAPQSPVRRAPEPEVQGEHRHYRILVVDDNRDAAFSMGAILRRNGHRVEVTYDGTEALVRGAELQPDLVIMDIGMPGMNGYEACRMMRERTWGRAASIVALSGWGQEADRQRSMDAGFDRHMVKPISMATLLALLTDLSRRSTPSEA